jgi:LysM repeat protein
MSSIRPLVTITILLVVGVFLYTKINQAPGQSASGTDGTALEAPADGVPALATGGATDSAESLTPAPWGDDSRAANNTAPQWADSDSDAEDASTPSLELPPARYESNAAGQTAGTVDDNGPGLPDLPEIPDLPPFEPSTGESESASAPPDKSKINLPANIPAARYPDNEDDAANDLTQSAAPLSGPASMPTMSRGAPDDMPTLGASAAHSMPTMSPPMSSTAPSTTAATGSNQYGSLLAEDTSDSFAGVWPEIQTALAQQELSHAHEMLSEWYGNPSLSSAESEQVESLLSQLAGTVVYSTEHRLEPPYVVRAGDTLTTIAAKYDVPWQLLAKINGIAAADGVQPGQEIKVIRGPFTAVVELGKQQLTLALNGRYAGRFAITAEPGAGDREGQWVVEQKLAEATAGTGDRTLVLRNGSPLAVEEAISITAGATTPSGPTAIAPSAIRLSASDAEELSDILSVGSRVVIRR